MFHSFAPPGSNAVLLFQADVSGAEFVLVLQILFFYFSPGDCNASKADWSVVAAEDRSPARTL